MGEHKIVEVIVDRDSRTPLHQQIADAISASIASGDFAPGDLLENEIAMGQRLGVSRPTVRQAMQTLVDRGAVLRVRGQGTRITARSIQRSMTPSSLFEDLVAAGADPQTKVIDYELVKPPRDIAQGLELPDDAKTMHFRRLRLTGEDPLAIMENHVPVAWAPSLQELQAEGLTALLRARGIVIVSATQSFSAINATPDVAELLHEPVGRALLVMTRVAFDEGGRPVEFGRHIYRASRYSVTSTVNI